jgi:hypothetical protein
MIIYNLLNSDASFSVSGTEHIDTIVYSTISKIDMENYIELHNITLGQSELYNNDFEWYTIVETEFDVSMDIAKNKRAIYVDTFDNVYVVKNGGLRYIERFLGTRDLVFTKLNNNVEFISVKTPDVYNQKETFINWEGNECVIKGNYVVVKSVEDGKVVALPDWFSIKKLKEIS